MDPMTIIGLGSAIGGLLGIGSKKPQTQMQYMEEPSGVRQMRGSLSDGLFSGIGNAFANMTDAMNGRINENLMGNFRQNIGGMVKGATGQAVSQLKGRGLGDSSAATQMYSGIQDKVAQQASENFMNLANQQYNWGNNWLNNSMNMWNMADQSDINRHWVKQTPASSSPFGQFAGALASGGFFNKLIP